MGYIIHFPMLLARELFSLGIWLYAASVCHYSHVHFVLRVRVGDEF